MEGWALIRRLHGWEGCAELVFQSRLHRMEFVWHVPCGDDPTQVVVTSHRRVVVGGSGHDLGRIVRP